MNRIHIVGVASRTGTTLMAELMHTCFAVDGYCEHELSIFRRPVPPVELLVTKRPTESEWIIPVLEHDPNLWVICMMRDPRDVVVSKHGKRPDIYWTNLRLWKQAVDSALRESERNARYILIRYEDLVLKPDETQEYLEKRIPFLKRKVVFSRYHEIARPSKDSVDAMRGIRPISSKSIGSWHHHKPRLKAQLELHGSIDRYLTILGYETDTTWKDEMEGVTAENIGTFKPEFDTSTFWERLRKYLKLESRLLRYRLGLIRKAKIKTVHTE